MGPEWPRVVPNASKNHTIVKVGKVSKIIESNLSPALPGPALTPVPRCHLHRAFEQSWSRGLQLAAEGKQNEKEIKSEF